MTASDRRRSPQPAPQPEPSSADEPLGEDEEDDDRTIPYDGRAFWNLLCEKLKQRFSDCDNDAARIRWLVNHCADKDDKSRATARRRFKRWAEGRRPHWENVEEVEAAIDRHRPLGFEDVDLKKCMKDLPLHGERPGALLSSEDPLVRLKAEVEAVLRKETALAAALARRGYQSPGAKDTAQGVMLRLIDTPAHKVAKDLGELAGTSMHRHAARHLFWRVLPLAGNWDNVLKEGQIAGDEGDVIELQLRTATFAEIVSARLDARCCVFAPGSKLQGAAHVALPATLSAPIFDPQGERLAEAVFMNLWDLLGKDELLPGEEVWRDMKTDCADEGDFKILAAAEINTPTLREARYYLLFIDVMVAPFFKPSDLEQIWAVAQAALRNTLPGLRIVRLKGRHKEMTNEAPLGTIVKRMRDLS